MKNPVTAVAWFGGIFSPEISKEISRLLSLDDFGLAAEQQEKHTEYEAAGQQARERLGYYGPGGIYIPPIKQAI